MTTFDLAKEWLRYAKSDFNTARHMFGDVIPKEIEISCYHSQQCAEKSLKAYLIANGIEPPNIHDLVELNNFCIASNASFSTIQQYCVFLNPYGVHVRYPNELAIDDGTTKQAIDNAEKLLLFCEKMIDAIIEKTE